MDTHSPMESAVLSALQAAYGGEPFFKDSVAAHCAISHPAGGHLAWAGLVHRCWVHPRSPMEAVAVLAIAYPLPDGSFHVMHEQTGRTHGDPMRYAAELLERRTRAT